MTDPEDRKVRILCITNVDGQDVLYSVAGDDYGDVCFWTPDETPDFDLSEWRESDHDALREFFGLPKPVTLGDLKPGTLFRLEGGLDLRMRLYATDGRRVSTVNTRSGHVIWLDANRVVIPVQMKPEDIK